MTRAETFLRRTCTIPLKSPQNISHLNLDHLHKRFIHRLVSLAVIVIGLDPW